MRALLLATPAAASRAIAAPLGAATAVWFEGGRQTRLVDAYAGTPRIGRTAFLALPCRRAAAILATAKAVREMGFGIMAMRAGEDCRTTEPPR